MTRPSNFSDTATIARQHGQRRQHDQARRSTKKNEPGRRARVPEGVERDGAGEARDRRGDGRRAAASTGARCRGRARSGP